MKSIKLWATISAVFLAAVSQAYVVNFDDLAPFTSLDNTTYAGVYFGSSSDNATVDAGFFVVYNGTDYATPHSGSNYIFDGYGPNNLYFDFGTPVSFQGAWFSSTFGLGPEDEATKVRFHDDLGNTSDWLDLSDTPQFLAANFSGSTTVYVERSGGPNASQWYAMDDLTYNGGAQPPVPEPATLLALGLGASAVLRKRRRS